MSKAKFNESDNQDIPIYFEHFSFASFASNFYKLNIFSALLTKNRETIYYIDASLLAVKCLIPLMRFLRQKIEQLHFEMKDIKDSNGELIRIRIPRDDLFQIQKEIIASKEYKFFFHSTWTQDRITDYINQGLTKEGIYNQDSLSRILFIINVVYWHMGKNQNNQSILIANNRAWFQLLKQYSLKYGVNLLNSGVSRFSTHKLKTYVMRFPNIYALLINIKHRNLFFNGYEQNNLATNYGKLYIQGRGDIDCNNNGFHSDFFTCFNSELPLNKILYKVHSKEAYKYLSSQGVHPVYERGIFRFRFKRNYIKPKLNSSFKYRQEFKVIKSLLVAYDLERLNWSIFFRKYNVKVFFTWAKFSNKHVAISDAIKDNEGVAAIWQMAFDGHKWIECVINSDVKFNFSKFDSGLEKKINSKLLYNVVSGYPKDYVPDLLKAEAKKIRDQLTSKGAKKIVFVIDENSLDDSRWHTGHAMQQENYNYILNKVLEEEWLGVVFKPKVSKTLFDRLGFTSSLLKKAMNTGRCYLFLDSGLHTTSAPPILAGLSADVCIHGHLCAGTAGIECALEGLPTLLIDREGDPISKLNELPEGKVVFQNWPSAIDALMKYFEDDCIDKEFGNWTTIIDDLDPFRDGLAANRIGNYLNGMLQDFDNNLDRYQVMKKAAMRYRIKWENGIVDSLE